MVLFLFARALPRIDDTNTVAPRIPQVPHWIIGYIERCDEFLLSAFEKFLRRLRVMLLKVDNAVSEKLKQFTVTTTQKETIFTRENHNDSSQTKENTVSS